MALLLQRGFSEDHLLPVQLILTLITKKDLLSLKPGRHQVVKSGLINLLSIFKIHKENIVFRKASRACRAKNTKLCLFVYLCARVYVHESVCAHLPTVEVENEEASG